MREIALKPAVRKRPTPLALRERLAERGALEVFATVARTADIPLDRVLDLWCHEPPVIDARCEAYARAWELLNLSSVELGIIVGLDGSYLRQCIRRAYDLRRERRRASRVA